MDAIEETKAPSRSLGALAELAVRQTNAAGYALYEWDKELGAFAVASSHGAAGPEIRNLCDLGIVEDGVESFWRWNGTALVGVVVFVFSPGHLDGETRETLQRLADSGAIQNEIWTRAVAATKATEIHGEAATSLVLSSLNEMVDITTTRTVALQTHI